MIVAIHQPSYFPWLGLLHKARGCDVFVLMDEVQLTDSAYQHRNQFLTTAGEVKYLSIPFVRKGYLDRPLRDIALADPHWARRHRDFLWNNYRKHPFAGELFERLEAFYAQTYATLFEVVRASMALSFEWMRIPARVVLQTSLDYDRTLRRGDLVLALVRAAGGDVYLSGTGARAYLDEGAFGRDVALRYDRFTHPVYPQAHSAAFVPGLACLDALFNVGLEEAWKLLVDAGTV
ncbi:MAG TPA: WbqC family protein [Ramlibacter sp.]|uniref:WbqC family protein n=1 Tax=Ramlibacter sp. TaxID=1917967 RepID=UPI002B801C4E|nr:WbqC family protein [Ramlibacter sp.]HVZ45351.1 WbqC family protein [Ramlibacter sp.]